jgi:hypothetical protein
VQEFGPLDKVYEKMKAVAPETLIKLACIYANTSWRIAMICGDMYHGKTKLAKHDDFKKTFEDLFKDNYALIKDVVQIIFAAKLIELQSIEMSKNYKENADLKPKHFPKELRAIVKDLRLIQLAHKPKNENALVKYFMDKSAYKTNKNVVTSKLGTNVIYEKSHQIARNKPLQV